MGMGAWGEAAVFRNLEHFRKIKRYLLLLQVYKAEAAKARRVYDESRGLACACTRKGIHFIKGSGMLALEMHVGYLSDLRVERRVQRLDQGRLSDA